MYDNKEGGSGCCHGIYWWAMLVVAVLAVPALGAVVALASGGAHKGLIGIVIFILTCWVCTYLGMKLMHHPKK